MRPFCLPHRSRLTITLLLLFFMCSCASVEKQRGAGACPDNLGSGIPDFCVVTPNVLWRGARPDQDGAAWLIQHGVRTVVNLELVLDDAKDGAARSATGGQTHGEIMPRRFIAEDAPSSESSRLRCRSRSACTRARRLPSTRRPGVRGCRPAPDRHLAPHARTAVAPAA